MFSTTQNKKDNCDRLLDVISFKQINLRQDYYKYDPDMELYNSSIFRNKYIFLNCVKELIYILIKRQ